MKYRYHWLFKLLALVLAVVSGAAILLGCSGLLMDDLGYYEQSRHSQLYRHVSGFLGEASAAVFDHFAWKDTGIEPKLFERFFRWGADVDAVDSLEHEFYYEIRSENTSQILESNLPAGLDWNWIESSIFDVRRGFVTEMPKAEYYPSFDQFQAASEGMVYVDLTGQALPALGEGVTDYEYYVVSDDSSVNWQNVSSKYYNHADANGADYTIYRIEYTHYESCHVDVYMTDEQAAALLDSPMEQEFLPQFLTAYHAYLAPMAIWGGLVLLMSMLWLALTAGKSPYKEGVKPDGLNRIPLDIYLVGVGFAAFALAMMTSMVIDQISYSSVWGYYDGMNLEDFFWDLALLSLCGMGAGGVVALFTMACAAQMKVGDNYWLKHTSIGLCWRYGWKSVVQAAKWCWSTAKRITRWFLGLFSAAGAFCRRTTALLPLTWQWLLVGFGITVLMFLCILHAVDNYSPLSMLLGCLIPAAVVLYSAYCFGTLRDAAKKMSEGDLEEKVENRHLAGCFSEFAGHLNALGDTCIEAAKQQMKSERMKSELITNVSHDIKTPLTSIINYVDLLQKTGDEAERREYLEVLDRQSQRLKKLIEDLMEMSRANSGNMSVEISPTDVCEAVNQALGEFSDTLQSCGLSVMRKMPQEPVIALCDGKHLWRVLSNILGNVVKYAMPGTRVYVDVAHRGQKVDISVKNISAKMLNISAEELMGRFVRGDASRNTEGNGLGLNIAKSLMELQGGRLELVVDGDLFKVILTLNAA